MDNQNVVRIVQYGSSKPHLQAEALSIFCTCTSSNIRIEPAYLKRIMNWPIIIVDYDDWILVFQWLDSLWGPHSVDRFASPWNSQTECFNSRFWALGTEAVDAFTCALVEENNWWVPPLHLMPRVIRHAQSTKAKGTLVAPQWVSSPFGPLLFPNGIDPAEFI